MPEPLIIVGAGGHARETAFAFLLSANPGSFLGFLDDALSGSTPEGWPILGPIGAAARHAQAEFVIAINDPRARRKVTERLGVLGITRWRCVIHPEVRLHPSIKMGVGCSILGGCQLTTCIELGHHCILNRGSQVSHDCRIGNFCSLNPAACVAGNVRVADGCELGSGCLIRQGSHVAEGSTIGMGAVVLKHVARNGVVVGNPSRLLRSNAPW